MTPAFEMCMVDRFKLRITDTTNPEDYLPENSLQNNIKRFKYKDSCTINVISHKKEIFDVFVTEHLSALNEVYYTLPIDGNYTIHHIILPTKEWFDDLKKNQYDFLENYSAIYYVDLGKFYKYTRTLVEGNFEDFNYNLKHVNSLDSDTNWYYLKQNSYFKQNSSGQVGPYNYNWYLLNNNSSVVNYVKWIDFTDTSYDDHLRQWCFVKNGNKINIYNRKTKKKLVYKDGDIYKPYLSTEPFNGWELSKADTNYDNIYRYNGYTNDKIFRLSRIIDNKQAFINANAKLTELSYYSHEGEEYDYGSDIIAENVTGVKYGKEYVETVQEVSIEEILNLSDNEEVSVIKTQADTFSICYLNDCFLKTCQDVYNSMSFNKCKKQDSTLTFNRDFLWMLINVIKYNLDLGYTAEALRVLDEFNTCSNNMCNCSSNINYGCGCS